MNKKFLGLFFILGLFVTAVQTANFNDELNAALLRRNHVAQTAEHRRNFAQNNGVNQIEPAEPEIIFDEPIEDVEPAEPEIIFDEPINNVNPVEPADQEVDNQRVEEVLEENNTTPQQIGFVQRWLGRWFNNTHTIANPAPTHTEAINHQANTENQHIFKCDICLTEISAAVDANDEERLEQTPCKHNFHLTCLNEWKTRDNICPKCREQLNTADNDDEERVRIDDVHKCSICFDPCLATNEGEHQVCATPCQHFFHKDCLNEWKTRDNTCPNCREPLNAVAVPITRATYRQRDEALEMQRQYEEEIRLLRESAERVQRERDTALTRRACFSTTTALGLAGAGAITASSIPGATELIKKTVTAGITGVCQLVTQHPRETAGIAAGGTALYTLKRGGITAREAKQFIEDQALNIALIGAAAYTAKTAIQANF